MSRPYSLAAQKQRSTWRKSTPPCRTRRRLACTRLPRRRATWEDNGVSRSKDEKRAVELWQQAAEQGHAASSAQLGWLTENGFAGFKRDVDAAIAMYTTAAGGEGDDRF